jgi:hypothetical protein
MNRAVSSAMTILPVLLLACSGGGGEPGPSHDSSGSTTQHNDAGKPADSADNGGKPSDDGGSSAGDAGKPAADGGPAQCPPKGTPGNEKGIGAYCDSAVQCPFGLLCSSDFGAPPYASFCTTPCAANADCGHGMTCVSDPRGQGCAPDACLYLMGK